MKRALVLLATAIVLGACEVRDEAQTAPKAETADAEAAVSAGDVTPEAAGIFDKLLNNGKPARLAIEQQHPNGGVLKLNSIQVKPTETVVNITYVNGHRNEVRLNWLSTNKRTYLLADNRKFYISPPITDEQIKVASGATVTGDLVFIGAVPQTSQLQLVVNENGSTSESGFNPKFVVDVPVTTAAWSDDGSKKNLAA